MMTQQRHIGDLLRFADKEIKNGNLELAMAYILKIFELEAKNVYAKAYRERIISLFEAKGISRTDAERTVSELKSMDLPTPKIEPPKPAPEPPAAKPLASKPLSVETKKSTPITVAKPAPPVAPSVIQQPAPKQRVVVNQPIPVQKIQRSVAASEAYRTLLMEIWKDGAITAEEQSRIDSMRETFAITLDEHTVFENEVRKTCYLNSIRDEWKKGITDFEPLRKKFGIQDSEKITLESKVFQLIQSLQAKGSVLVLDDEESFLQIIKGLLEESGYYCFTAATGEEGLQLLETMSPDIVVCDINFTKPNMSGFAFYEKFRSIDKFLTTPFIFISGLDQDVLVRTGKKLGADDYLFKPIDAEMLMATIEGKLRRSRELKRAM